MSTRQIVAERYFEPPSEELRFLPEGPRVLRNHPGGGNLLGWVAIQHAADLKTGSLNVLDLESGKNRNSPLPGRPGFFVETTRPGVVLVGLERRLVYYDVITGALEQAAEVTADERVIINDGVAVEGGVLFGTKHLEFNQRIAALYYFDAATRRVHTVIGRELCSNGKIFERDADGATLIEIDSIPKTISRYRMDAKLERVLGQSLIIPADALPSSPDGMRPSPDGESAVVAFYNSEAVTDGAAWQIRLADGEVLCKWIFPGSPRVTCPEFVTIHGKVKLLFTTAVENMPASIRQIAPGAGTLYLADSPFDEMPAPPPLILS